MSEKLNTKIPRSLYVLVLCIVALLFVYPFLVSIAFAATIAMTLFPLVLKLESKGLTRKMAAAVLTIVFTFLISIPLFFFLIKGVIEVTQLLENISFKDQLKDQSVGNIVSNFRHDILIYVQKYAHKLNVAQFLTDKKIEGYIDTVNFFLLKFFRDFLTAVPAIFLLFLVMVLCTYSFLKNGEKVKSFFKALFGFSDETMNHLVKIFIRDSRQIYVTNIVTGGVQSFFVAVGGAVLGIGEFFIIFFVTLILSFIPVIGAAPVAFALALLSLLQGKNTEAIIMVVVGIFAGIIDNFLRPWLASYGETKAPPIVSFVFLLGGAYLLGFPGLFIGIFVGSIAYDTLPIFWEELNKNH